jgi:streptogramin lyase
VSGTLGPQYALPAGNNYPLHATLGPDGALYATENATNQIARMQ